MSDCATLTYLIYETGSIGQSLAHHKMCYKYAIVWKTFFDRSEQVNTCLLADREGGGEVYHHHTVLHGVPARQRTVPTLMYTLQPGRNTIQHQLAGAGARGGGGGGTSGVF